MKPFQKLLKVARPDLLGPGLCFAALAAAPAVPAAWRAWVAWGLVAALAALQAGELGVGLARVAQALGRDPGRDE